MTLCVIYLLNETPLGTASDHSDVVDNNSASCRIRFSQLCSAQDYCVNRGGRRKLSDISKRYISRDGREDFQGVETCATSNTIEDGLG